MSCLILGCAVFPVKITFLEKLSGDKITVDASPGKSILDIAIENDVDIEGKLFCMCVFSYC